MDPKIVPLGEKRTFLQSLSEDEFRDKVVRPLFQRKGFVHGAELCGVNEEGKDCYFTQPAAFGGDVIYVVQTKVGNLNLGRDPGKSLLEAETQMRTALFTPVRDLRTKVKKKPNFAFLCTSGAISHGAKDHVIEQIGTANISFLDIDLLVPEIDNHFPEFWQGIKVERYPYLDRLAAKLVAEDNFAALASLVESKDIHSPVSDKGFVSLKLTRTFLKPKKVSGQVTQQPDFEELNVDELLKKNLKRIWILGEAGSGKTILQKRIAGVLCRKGKGSGGIERLPILLRAVDVAAFDGPLVKQLFDTTAAITPSGHSALGVDELHAGNACVLIDALDEVASQVGLDSLLQKLGDFSNEYGLNQIIITSRNYSYLREHVELGNYVRYSISPLGIREANKILHNVGGGKKIPPEKAKEILRQLENIHGFDLNPLVVTIFAASADVTRRDIPCNVTELFAKFVETMLGRWDSQKGLSQQYESGLKQLLLQGIAVKMHKEKVIRIPTERFRSLIADELESLGATEAKTDVLVDEILNRSGLLHEMEGFTEFRHLLIQEFFAGRALVEEPNIGRLAVDEWWQRALVFFFGSNPKNVLGLKSLCVPELAIDARELFVLAGTVGLATQACYFVKLAPKTEIMDWVVKQLAESNSKLLAIDDSEKYPLHSFILGYLMARDSVAAECMSELSKFTSAQPIQGSVVSELEHFWLIVGLMESGHLAEAAERIKKFHPENQLCLLALHMGAVMIQHVRSASKESKRIAGQISEKLGVQVIGLVAKYLKEFRSQLLEWQKGEVKELRMVPNEGDENENSILV